MHPRHHANFSDIERNYNRFLPKDRSSSFLDIGCGSGRVIAWLEEKGYSSTLGVDISEEALAKVPAKYRAHTKRIDRLDLFLMENRGSFDFVFAKDVIYYFSRKELIATMEKIRNALKPGGTLIVEVFNGAAQTGPYIKYKDYRIQWIFTEHSLAEVLRDSGFRVERIDSIKSSGLGLRSFFTKILGWIWRCNLRLVYWAERGADVQNPKLLTKKIYAVATVP